MQTIIQGNDTTLTLIPYLQELLLPDSSGTSSLERRKVDFALARNIAVRLIPYMRWEAVTPLFVVEGSAIHIAFTAPLQKPGKWDIELTCYLPTGGDATTYTQCTLRVEACEVIPRSLLHRVATSEAFTITADLAVALKGEKGDRGKDAYTHYLETTADDPKLSEAEWADSYLAFAHLLRRI